MLRLISALLPAQIPASPDSLFMQAGDTLSARVATTASVQQMAAAESIFGHSSFIATPTLPMGAVADSMPLITDSPFYSIAVLICFLSACLILYSFKDYVFGIFNIIRGNMIAEKMLGEQSNVFSSFLAWTVSLGLLICALTALRFADMAGNSQIMPSIPAWAPPLLIVGAWALSCLTWGYQFLILKIAGSLTFSSEFTLKLLYLKKIIAALATLVLIPVFLFFALSEGHTGYVLGIIILGLILLLAIFLIIRTFMLFIRQNFPILLWFLYLCVVEIFPISLIFILVWKILG